MFAGKENKFGRSPVRGQESLFKKTFGWCRCGVGKKLMRGDSLNVLERDFLCLPGHHGKDIHLQSAETQSCIVLQLGAKALQHHIIAALSNGTEERGLPTIGVTVQTCSSGATSMTISCDQLMCTHPKHSDSYTVYWL